MSTALLEGLLPHGISLLGFIVLCIASFLTAALSAAMGVGGGVVLLALMTQFIPMAALIPTHAVVQVGANFSRALLQRRHAVWWLIGLLLVGFCVGGIVGGLLFVNMPERAIKAGLAIFILYSAWGAAPQLRGSGRALLLGGGAVASVLTMFIGSTGPFVLAILRRFPLDRVQLIGTHAVAMLLQHGLKIVVFGALGFAFAQWMPLVVAMVLTGFAGTWAGTRLLRRLPEQGFRTGVKILLTILAGELLVEAALPGLL